MVEAYIERTTQFELLAVCSNALEAKEALKRQQVDLIFLDIQLPGMTGLNFLRALEKPPLVILTTAYPDYALESYEFNVIDYLLKPFSYERFLKAVNKIVEGNLLKQKTAITNDHIYIKSSGKFIRVNFADIIYIEGMKDYLKICTSNSNIVTLQTMNEMERSLPPAQFIRVHKSYIVSLQYIKSIYGNNIETSRLTIPIGVNYKEKVMQLVSKRFS